MRSTISLERESIKKNFFKRVRSKKIGVQEISQLVEVNHWLASEIDGNFNTVLHYAALSGDMDKMNYFLGQRVNIISPDESGIKTIVTIKMPDAIKLVDPLALNSFGHNAVHYFNCEDSDSHFEYKKKKSKKPKDVDSIAIAETGVRYSEVNGSYFPNIVSSGSLATVVSVAKISDDNKLPSIKR